MSIYITYVEKEPPFLKIWGQIDKTAPLNIERMLQQMAPAFDSGQFMISTLEKGIICCAKYKDGSYYRCIIINTTYMGQGVVEVMYIDYGNKEYLKINSLRNLDCVPQLKSILPQGKHFILAGFLPIISNDANDVLFDMVSSELRYGTFDFKISGQIGRYQLISLLKNGMDFTPHLVIRGFGSAIDPQKQYMVLQNPHPLQQPMGIPVQQAMYSPLPTQPAPVPTPTLPTLITYKPFSLEIGSEHEIYISYVNDGPCLFYIQLKKMENQLKELMSELNSFEPMNLEESPLPGAVCLARSQGDNYICRAVVTSMVDEHFKVFYVDFGNTEILPFDKLYQIPYKYIIPKVMSTRFSLYGLNNCVLSLEMKCAFKSFVNDKALWMKVKPPNPNSTLALCELKDQGICVLEHVKKFALQSYPECKVIIRGATHDVIVTFVYSCSRFYVRLKNKTKELDDLMENLGSYCSKAKPLDVHNLNPGVPCNALFLDDGMFYRAKILEVDRTQAKVFYVDYGNEEYVNVCNLRATTPMFVTQLRPQAIQCCLAGYQNMSFDQERDGLLEELILEQEFSMKVVEIMDNKILIDLFDSSGINVASKLCEKIAQNKGLFLSPRGEDCRKRSPPDNKSPRGFSNKVENTWESRNVGGSWRDEQNLRPFSDESDSPPRKDNFSGKLQSSPTYKSRSNDWKDKNNEPEFRKQDSRGRGGEQTITRDFKKNDRGDRWDSKQDEDKRDFGNRRDGGRRDRDEGKKEWDNKRENRREPYRSNESTEPSWGGNQQESSSWNNNREDRKGSSSSWNRDDNRRGGDRKNRNTDNDNEWSNKNETKSWDTKESGKDSWSKKKNDGDEGFGNHKRDRDDSSGYKRNDRGDSWGNKNTDKDNSWGNKRSDTRNNSWGSKQDNAAGSWGDAGNQDDSTKSTYQKRSGGSYNKRGRDDNYNKNTDGSEKSWNGSDKGGSKFKSQSSWSDSTEKYDYAENNAVYAISDVVGKTWKVEVTYFYNPNNFYSQIKDKMDELSTIMKEIQKEYRKAKIFTDAPVNCPVIALFPEDNVLYRAIVLSNESGNYSIRYVDFGNTSQTRKVFKIQKKHLNFPVLAYNCTLNNVAPNGEKWGDHSTFAKYFGKDQIDCSFLSVEENLHYVELSFNGKPIRDEIIENSLAIDTAEPPFDLNVLWGQQIRCQIASINNPGDMIVEIQPGFFLPAHIHDFDKATQIFEDKLQPLISQFIIIYVNYVLNERLDLDLYDTEGNKIQIIEPDEGLPTVNPVCPLTVYSYNMEGYVSHASETSIFVQPTYNAETITNLLDEMFNACNELQIVELTPIVNKVYAVLSPDTNWYRGQVVSINEKNVNVYYIDYGNCEDVTVDDLRELPKKFYELHMLCLEILIENSLSYLETEILLTLKYGDDGWVGTVNSNPEPEPVTIATKEVLETVNTPVEDTVNIVESVENQKETPVLQGFAVALTHFDTPGQFYLQTTESFEAIELLQERLQNESEALPKIENVTIGALCAAKYSVDEQWYRAKVLDFDSDITTIRFIDYGNTDVLDNTASEIKTLPQDLLLIEEYAKRCSLYVSPINNEWSTEACDRFMEIIKDKELSAEILDQDEKATFVELYDGNNPVSPLMINEGHASEVVIESKNFTGFISNLNSPSEFWIQLESSCNDLEWVAEQLVNGDSFTELKDMEPGTLCAAIFPEDESWYRARILSNTIAGLEVLFIDYGNSCMCTSLRELPEELAVVAPLASKCSLQKLNGILQWGMAATDKFKSIAADGATIFTINKISHGETSVVQLLLNDVDVALSLVPDVTDACIINVESLEEFYITEFYEELEEYNKYLQDNASSWDDIEAPEGVVIGLNEGKKWMRCKKLEDRIFFIDYGKTGACEKFKSLPEDDATAEPFAALCRLEPPPGFKWGDDSNSLFIEVCKTGDLVQVEKVSVSTVRLYINFEDVRLHLNMMKCTPVSSTYSSPKKSKPSTNSELAAQETIDNLLASVGRVSINTSDVCMVIDGITTFEGESFSQKSDKESLDDDINFNNECDIGVICTDDSNNLAVSVEDSLSTNGSNNSEVPKEELNDDDDPEKVQEADSLSSNDSNTLEVLDEALNVTPEKVLEVESLDTNDSDQLEVSAEEPEKLKEVGSLSTNDSKKFEVSEESLKVSPEKVHKVESINSNDSSNLEVSEEELNVTPEKVQEVETISTNDSNNLDVLEKDFNEMPEIVHEMGGLSTNDYIKNFLNKCIDTALNQEDSC